MEEPAPQTSPTERAGAHRQRRRRTKHHGPFHLHRAQKKMLKRAGVFVALLIAIIILWYWMVMRK